MPRIDTTIRQWCPTCGRATVSKTCSAGHWPDTYCAECSTCSWCGEAGKWKDA